MPRRRFSTFFVFAGAGLSPANHCCCRALVLLCVCLGGVAVPGRRQVTIADLEASAPKWPFGQAYGPPAADAPAKGALALAKANQATATAAATAAAATAAKSVARASGEGGSLGSRGAGSRAGSAGLSLDPMTRSVGWTT